MAPRIVVLNDGEAWTGIEFSTAMTLTPEGMKAYNDPINYQDGWEDADDINPKFIVKLYDLSKPEDLRELADAIEEDELQDMVDASADKDLKELEDEEAVNTCGYLDSEGYYGG